MARRAQLTLASNAGAGAQASVDWQGGRGMLFGEGTWGGGNAALQMQSPNGTWVPIYDAAGNAVTITVNGGKVFEAPAGPLRANITTASAVYAYAVGIPTNNAG
jgi:hypothetical protein